MRLAHHKGTKEVAIILNQMEAYRLFEIRTPFVGLAKEDSTGKMVEIRIQIEEPLSNGQITLPGEIRTP